MLVSLLVIVSAIIYFGLKSVSVTFNSNDSASEWREIEIKNEKFRLEVADSDVSRQQGLSGRDDLPSNQGMLFIFDKPARYGFWMKGMKFPLDIIWLNKGEVIYIVENAPPDNNYKPMVYNPTAEADLVIELRAGEVSRLGLKIGDILSF